jgi:hypothetical protein
LFRELLADDKEIITKYKEFLNARTAPKYLKEFHSEIREIQKCGLHIQQIRPLLASADNFLMQFPQFHQNLRQFA